MTSKQDRVLLGMITPSSNTTLEPVTARMLAGLPRAQRPRRQVSRHRDLDGLERPGRVRHGADARRRRPARRCALQRRLLERHLGRLARLRSRPRALRRDRAADRHPRNLVSAGAARRVPPRRCDALRPRVAVYRRHPAGDRRQLRPLRLRVRRRASHGHPRELRLLHHRAGGHRSHARRGGRGATAGGRRPVHEHGRRRARRDVRAAQRRAAARFHLDRRLGIAAGRGRRHTARSRLGPALPLIGA